jgi:hypothetical protein
MKPPKRPSGIHPLAKNEKSADFNFPLNDNKIEIDLAWIAQCSESKNPRTHNKYGDLKQLLDGDGALSDTGDGARTQTEIPTMRRRLQQTSGHAVCYAGTLRTRLLQLQTGRKHRLRRMLHEGINEDSKGSCKDKRRNRCVRLM